MRASQTEPIEQGQEHSNHYYYLPSFISLFLCKGAVSFIMIIINNDKYIYIYIYGVAYYYPGSSNLSRL